MYFWDMLYGDALKYEILRINSPKQKKYLLEVFERMGNYVAEHDDSLTFQEYFEMFEK